jgi:helicase
MPNLVNSVAAALQARLELLSSTGEATPAHFRERTTKSSALAAEWLPGQPTSAYLRSGIGVHYGALPDGVRKAVESDFRDRRLRVLVATNTLAQGVNLPFKTVVVHSVWRYDEATRAQVRLPARDYWNIAGRAGRAGEETEGLVIHTVVTNQDLRDYQGYLARRDNPEPVQSALFADLLDLVGGRLTPEGLRGELDAEVLALLVEEGEIHDIGSVITRGLRGTLAQVQATRQGRSLQRLATAMTAIGTQIVSEVSDSHMRTLFATTGLSTESCRQLAEHIRQNEVSVRRVLSLDGRASVNDLLSLMVPPTLQLQEMQTRYTFAGNNTDLLDAWTGGVEIAALGASFGDDSRNPENFARYIEDLFSYRLPWGLSAYIRIAIDILGIDALDLPLAAHFLPAMVRNGLPDPEACWVMAAGVPFRTTAIEVASAFRREVEVPDFGSFLEWVNRLSAERLQFDFHLGSPVLEDVSRAVLAFGRNNLLREFTTLREFLPRSVPVAGIAYENRRLVALQLSERSEVNLTRDYDNLIDRNAISVLFENQLLGYLPRDVAQVVAPEMDSGAEVGGIVESVSITKVPEVSIVVELRSNQEVYEEVTD